jgi:zinc protease
MNLFLKLLFTIIPVSFVTPGWAATTDPMVHEYQLKNGLKLIVKEDHRAPVVITQVWYKVGSSYEHSGTTGISHALEHMMFRGTKNYSAENFLQTVAENGGQQNAFTSSDYTAYYEIISNDKLPLVFKLEADRMRNLSLRPENFTKEIQVVMEERRMRTEDDPQQLTYERFMAAAHVANPYHHPVIGWMDDLKHMTVNDLRQWYQTWYAPNNAILVVVGDVKPEDVYQLAQKYFGPISRSELPAIKPEKEVTSLGTRTITVAAPAQLPYLLMGYNTPAVTTAKEQWQPYALLVLAGVLDSGNSSRLESRLVRGKQLASQIDVDYDLYSRLDNLLVISATPAPGFTIDQVENEILDQIKQLQDQLVTADELERVKAQVIAGKVYQKDSLSSEASEIGSLEAVGLSWREADQVIEKIQKITPEQVQSVAREYLITKNMTTAILQPLPIKNPTKQMPPRSLGDQHVH